MMKLNKLVTLIALSGVIILQNNFAVAQSDRFGISEKHLHQLPKDVMVLSEDSVLVNLYELIDKPTILSFVYFKCPGLCSPTMEGIAEVIDKTNLEAGRDYQVFTISIDERETPSLARQKKRNYVSSMEKKDAASHWKFFTADSSSIKELTDVTGFEFKREGEDFAHSAAIMVLTPDARISQYMYGTFYLPMHFKMAILDAYEGEQVPTRIKVLKYCYNFVPPENENFIFLARTGGIIIVFFTVGLLLFLLIDQRKKKAVLNHE